MARSYWPYRVIIALVVLLSGFCLPALGDQEAGEGLFEFDGDKELLVEVSSVLSISSAAPGSTYEAAVLADIDEAWHINSSRPYQDWLIPARLEFDTIPGITPHSIIYPEGNDAILAGETMSVYDGRLIFRFRVTVDQEAGEGDYALPVRLTYQACNDRECRPPQTQEANLTIAVGEEGRPVSQEIFGASGSKAEPPPAVTGEGEETELDRLISRYGLWGYFMALGLAFITGLLLSFSPCTYPMIPITVSIFAGQQRSIGRGFVLSLFYVGSMAIVYGIMGLVVSLVGGVFGAWLASPPVVIGIAAIFIIFSLSMFGLYELNMPSSLRQRLGKTKGGGGVFGAIVLGIVAALVVSPCVGPFVAGILLYVATHGSPVIGFLVLFVFALGLGTLFLIIGTFSSAISALPGAGGWMETIKKFFGFVLLLMALYFLKTIVSPGIIAVLTGLLLTALGVFGGGLDRLTPETAFFPRLKKFVGVLALLAGIYLLAGSMITQGLILPPASQWLPGAAFSHMSSSPGIDWETDLESGLARARSEGKPVLIDTWATWCVNCKVLERKTFSHPDIIKEAERFVSLKVQLETADSPITKDFMDRFGWKHYSLPTTVLINSQGQTARTLKGVIGPGDMLEEMRSVR